MANKQNYTVTVDINFSVDVQVSAEDRYAAIEMAREKAETNFRTLPIYGVDSTVSNVESASEEEKTGEVELTVRLYDGETGEFMECNDYTMHDVPESVARALDKDGKMDSIFPLLFEEYSYDFPDEEPGVEAVIDEWKVDWSTFT